MLAVDTHTRTHTIVRYKQVGLLDYGKNHNPDYFVNIGITIIETIIFLGNILHFFTRDRGGLCVCVTKPERFWELQHIKCRLGFLCGGSAAGQQT